MCLSIAERHDGPTFDFVESTLIAAAPEVVWEFMIDLERWWPASNPDHESLQRLGANDQPITVGTRLRIGEKIAGVPGEAEGEITELKPGSAVTWEAPVARYRLCGVPASIGEGVTWTLEGTHNGATDLSAHVWATFPAGVYGRLLHLVFTHLLHGIAKDREHTRTELCYLKRMIEQTTT